MGGYRKKCHTEWHTELSIELGFDTTTAMNPKSSPILDPVSGLPPTAARDPLAPPHPPALSSPEIVCVPVALGTRSYDVLIRAGLLTDAGALIANRLPGAKVAIVTDANVARHHLPALEARLVAASLHKGTVVLPPGEASKGFAVLGALSERLLEMGLERGDAVVAFGGGVIGDLAGFAAAILRRGVRLIQIPTTLLAQVDSSVGGKTGINTPQGKNLIGAFHQPTLVLIDPDVLKTLPPREVRAGYAEVAKYGLLGDAAFFARLEHHPAGWLEGGGPALLHAIETSVRAKAGIVARDETEQGERALLNLGHTFGHALETWTGYSDRLLHGEAVAIGMCLAFQLSEALGHCAQGTAARVASHLSHIGLPTRIGDIAMPAPADPAELLRLMRQDKKVRQGRLTFILARAIGDAFIAPDVAPETVLGVLERGMAA